MSDDLHHWERSGPEPVVRVDGRWYKNLANTPAPTEGPDLEGSSETWRDPLVFADPDGDGWHMFVSARARDAARNDDGVVAHATSPDLETWTLGPPLCEPGAGFGQLEVLQNKQIDGRWVLVFTCHPQEMTAERIARTGEYCTWSVPGAGPLGPWDIDAARPFSRGAGPVRGAPGAAARRLVGARSASATSSPRASTGSRSPTPSRSPWTPTATSSPADRHRTPTRPEVCRVAEPATRHTSCAGLAGEIRRRRNRWCA